MPDKKILLYTRPITPPWDEASKNLAFDIATNLTKTQFQINLLTPKKNPFNLILNENYHHIKTESIYSSPNSNLNLRGKLELLSRLISLKPRVDLIHFLFTPRSLTSFIIKNRLKNTGVKTIQTIATLSKENLTNQKNLKKVLFADVIIAQSKNTFEKLKSQGIKNVELIYPGINLNKYQPREKDPATLEKMKIKKTDFIVLYTGEYIRLKAIDDIVDSLKILFKNPTENSELKFVFACRIKSSADQEKKQEIIKTLKEYFLESKVIFLDTVTEMAKLYNISDLNIFPVREMIGKFDIPLTVVESMACGKPVIVSDLENLLELTNQGKAGLICKKNNPKDLAEKIKLLKTNKKLYNKLSKDALNFIRESFDIKKNVKVYDNVYKKLLS